MILLDASYFLALVNEKDVHHQKAKEIAERIQKEEYGKILTTDHILDESISVSLRKLNKEKSLILGKNIMESVPYLISHKHHLIKAWAYYEKTTENFSFTDCLSIIICLSFKIEYIATFDKAFHNIQSIKVIGIPTQN